MCTLVILKDRVAGWPLVVGANRDEYRDRPWERPRWDGALLAPRDLRAGGTWIALHRRGLLVALANRPEADPDPSRPSRGILGVDLARQGTVEAARTFLREDLSRQRRNSFSVLLASASECWVGVHPDPEGGPLEEMPVVEGLHHLSNRRGLDQLDHRGALDHLDLPAGSPLPLALDRMQAALATHADSGPGGPDEICKHGEDRGTLSSAIVALPPRRSREAPFMLFAPGAPCRQGYVPIPA